MCTNSSLFAEFLLTFQLYSKEIVFIFLFFGGDTQPKSKGMSAQGHHFPSALRHGIFVPYVSATRKC